MKGRVPGIRILRSMEVDILRDGSLGMDDDTIAGLDLVVASVHSFMKMDAAAMTERIVRALRHPMVDVLGHPTGRILGRRPPFELDMDAVLQTAAERDVHFLGLEVESRERWRPAGFLLQTSGLLIVLGAAMYSERPWPDLSASALAVGLVCLIVPLLLAYRSVGRDPFMPAVHVALGFAFPAVFLDRATPLSDDAIVSAFDAVLVVVVLGLVLRLRRSTGAPEEEWALNAFAAALYAGLVIVMFTALGPLDLEADAVWVLDLWLALVTALTLWGLHRAPPALQRGWFGGQLGLCVLFWIPLGFFTIIEKLDLPAEAATVGVGGVGGLALAYGCVRRIARCWWPAASRCCRPPGTTVSSGGGALGAVAALAATAALLF